MKYPFHLDPDTAECEHEWIEMELPCEICVGHQALYCDKCCTPVDLITYDDPRRTDDGSS